MEATFDHVSQKSKGDVCSRTIHFVHRHFVMPFCMVHNVVRSNTSGNLWSCVGIFGHEIFTIDLYVLAIRAGGHSVTRIIF